jgi:hypothetical protein
MYLILRKKRKNKKGGSDLIMMLKRSFFSQIRQKYFSIDPENYWQVGATALGAFAFGYWLFAEIERSSMSKCQKGCSIIRIRW